MTDEERMTELYEEMDREDKKITFKCKPTYQFQSIEFEVRAAECEISMVLDLYKKVLEGLIRISPEQEKKVLKPAEPLASDKQKDIMKKFGIKYNEKTTQSEAQKLIKESMENSLR